MRLLYVMYVSTMEFLFGSTKGRGYTEPARLEKKIRSSIYPQGWNPKSMESYNNWCEDRNVSTRYHIRQTNNITWK